MLGDELRFKVTIAFVVCDLALTVSLWAAEAVSATHPSVAEAEVTALQARVIRRRIALLSEATCFLRTID
jgi:hypothetical protein